jgi:hypothetical protein
MESKEEFRPHHNPLLVEKVRQVVRVEKWRKSARESKFCWLGTMFSAEMVVSQNDRLGVVQKCLCEDAPRETSGCPRRP